MVYGHCSPASHVSSLPSSWDSELGVLGHFLPFLHLSLRFPAPGVRASPQPGCRKISCNTGMLCSHYLPPQKFLGSEDISLSNHPITSMELR